MSHNGDFLQQTCEMVKFDLDGVSAWQVHISHIGKVRFKGLAEPQTVMQFSTAHLAARQFPPESPSAKAELVRLPTYYDLEILKDLQNCSAILIS